MNLIDQFIKAAQANPVVQGIGKAITSPSPAQEAISQLGSTMANVPIDPLYGLLPGDQNSQTFGENPQIQQMVKSPVSQLIQGKYNQIIPAAKQELADIQSGKYQPQISFGGEMEEVPSTEVPTIKATQTDLPPIKTEAPKGNYPYEKTPSYMQKLGQGQNQNVRQIRIPGSLDSAQQEQEVNNTLDRLGFKGTAAQQHAQLQPKMTELNDWIENESSLNKSPQLVSLDNEVKPALTQELKKQFPVGGPTSNAASQAVNNYLNDLYDAAGGTVQSPAFVNGIEQMPDNIVPENIDTPTLYKMKIAANQAAGNVFKKLASGQPLSDLDKVTLSGRNTLDSIITKYHPDVKQATMDMSKLYDAASSLEKARFNPPPDLQLLPRNILGTELPPIVRDPLNKMFTSPKFWKGAGLVAGGAGLAFAGDKGYQSLTHSPNGINNSPQGGPYESQGNGNNSQNNGSQNNTTGNSDHSGIISQSYSNIKPDAKSGKIELPSTPPTGQNTRHYMTTQDYQNGLQQLAQQYPAGASDPHYTVAKNLLDTQFANDQKQADEVFKGNNVKNFMDNAVQYNNDGKDLLDTLHSLPTGFWNGVKGAGSIGGYVNPQYAQELQQIDSFNNEFTSAYESVTGQKPTENQLLSSANSPQQAAQKYISMMQFISGTYGKYLAPYAALTSATGAQTQAGTPQNLNTLPPIQATPQNANAIVGGTPPSAQYNNGQWSLPPIQ